MSQEQSQTVNINGKDYDPNELSGEQQYLITQLRDLQQKSDNLKFQVDQVSAAQKVFTDALVASVDAPEEGQG